MDIKPLRQRAGLTQKQLALRAGCHVTQIQKLEYGLSDLGNLTARTYLRLCDALGQPYTLLRDLEDEERSQS